MVFLSPSTLNFAAAASFNILSNSSFEAVSSQLLTASPSARNNSPQATYSLSLLLRRVLGHAEPARSYSLQTGISAHYQYRKTHRACTPAFPRVWYVCIAVWGTVFVIRAVIFDVKVSRFFDFVAS